mmetsp:Transcript_39450/g.125407  ORF Transcript_39450/g.125407 Transcript_39450/m.125407 type:complete len:253 (+) Transcript_39450:1049-1807(+)
MNSLISRRIMASAEPKKVAANVLHRAVLPTPVGPENIKLAIGLSGLRRPARARRKALETLRTASCWPTMLSCSSSSRRMRRADSEEETCSTAMPVQLDTTWATSSSVTCCWSSCASSSAPRPSPWRRCSVSASQSFSSWASSKRWAAAATCTCALTSCSCATSFCTPPAFVPCPSSMAATRLWSSNSCNFTCCASSKRSSMTAARFLRCSSSSSVDSVESSAVASADSTPWNSCCRTLEPASSITSMALSGR